MGIVYHYYKLLKHYTGLEDEERLRDFLDLLKQTVKRGVEAQQKIGLYLTGGIDSRSILAVLLDLGINPTAITYPRGTDYKIAKQITNQYNLDHIKSSVGSRDYDDRHHQMVETHRRSASDFDVVFAGLFMDEIWGVFDFARRRLYSRALRHDRVTQLYDLMRANNNLLCPAIDRTVIERVFQLNDYYLKEKRLQKEIIREFKPELLDVELHSLSSKTTRIKEWVDACLDGSIRYG